MFHEVGRVAEWTGREESTPLHRQQNALHAAIKRREAWMGASEVAIQFSLWIGCLLVLWTAPHGWWMPVERLDAGQLALFVANVRFVGSPLIEACKAFNKLRSSEAALLRAVHLEDRLGVPAVLHSSGEEMRPLVEKEKEKLHADLSI